MTFWKYFVSCENLFDFGHQVFAPESLQMSNGNPCFPVTGKEPFLLPLTSVAGFSQPLPPCSSCVEQIEAGCLPITAIYPISQRLQSLELLTLLHHWLLPRLCAAEGLHCHCTDFHWVQERAQGLWPAVCARHPVMEDNTKPLWAPNDSIVSGLHKVPWMCPWSLACLGCYFPCLHF